MNNRLKEIRKYFNLTQKEFASKLGITPTSVSRMETGERNITEQTIKVLSFQFNINPDWLINGKGNMFDNSKDLISLVKNCDDLKKEIIYKLLKLDTDSLKALQKLF